MKNIFFILVFVSFPGFIQSQDLIGKWTNGIDVYWSNKYSDSVLIFSGGNLHEGGASFSVKILDRMNYRIIGRHPENVYPPSFGLTNQLLALRKIRDIKVLVIQENNEIFGLLQEIPQYVTLEDIVYQNKINFELAGDYVDSLSKIEISFETNIPIIEGLGVNENYKFETDYDYPIEVITLDSGKTFYYEKTVTGLKLYNAKKDNYGDWIKDNIIYNLTRVSNPDIVENKLLKGNYQFASDIILTDDILYYFDKRELRLIRNEIFARHGYKFKSTDMKDYFENQDWYIGNKTNVDSLLTELELINIGQIRRFEK